VRLKIYYLGKFLFEDMLKSKELFFFKYILLKE